MVLCLCPGALCLSSLAVAAFPVVIPLSECLSPYRPGAASGLVSSGKCCGQYQQRAVTFPNVTITLILGLEVLDDSTLPPGLIASNLLCLGRLCSVLSRWLRGFERGQLGLQIKTNWYQIALRSVGLSLSVSLFAWLVSIMRNASLDTEISDNSSKLSHITVFSLSDRLDSSVGAASLSESVLLRVSAAAFCLWQVWGQICHELVASGRPLLMQLHHDL